MRSGDTRNVVAMCLVLRGGFNSPFCVTLRFPVIFFFFFLCLVFKTSFLSSFFFIFHFPLLLLLFCVFSPNYHSHCDFLCFTLFGVAFLRYGFFLPWFAFHRVDNLYGFLIFPFFFSFYVLLVSLGSCPSSVAF